MKWYFVCRPGNLMRMSAYMFSETNLGQVDFPCVGHGERSDSGNSAYKGCFSARFEYLQERRLEKTLKQSGAPLAALRADRQCLVIVRHVFQGPSSRKLVERRHHELKLKARGSWHINQFIRLPLYYKHVFFSTISTFFFWVPPPRRIPLTPQFMSPPTSLSHR